MLITVKRALAGQRCLYIPEEHRVGWTAGFLEGDGGFYNWIGNNGNTAYFRIAASQVHKPPVYTLKKLYGGNLRYCIETRGNANNRWHWELPGDPAILLAKEIYPLMPPKRQKQIYKGLRAIGILLKKEVIDNDS